MNNLYGDITEILNALGLEGRVNAPRSDLNIKVDMNNLGFIEVKSGEKEKTRVL